MPAHSKTKPLTLIQLCVDFPDGGIARLSRLTGVSYRSLQRAVYAEDQSPPERKLRLLGRVFAGAGTPWAGMSGEAKLKGLWWRGRIARLRAELRAADSER